MTPGRHGIVLAAHPFRDSTCSQVSLRDEDHGQSETISAHGRTG